MFVVASSFIPHQTHAARALYTPASSVLLSRGPQHQDGRGWRAPPDGHHALLQAARQQRDHHRHRMRCRVGQGEASARAHAHARTAPRQLGRGAPVHGPPPSPPAALQAAQQAAPGRAGSHGQQQAQEAGRARADAPRPGAGVCAPTLHHFAAACASPCVCQPTRHQPASLPPHAQKSFHAVTCAECGMVYAPGCATDEQLHKDRHAAMRAVLSFPVRGPRGCNHAPRLRPPPHAAALPRALHRRPGAAAPAASTCQHHNHHHRCHDHHRHCSAAHRAGATSAWCVTRAPRAACSWCWPRTRRPT